MDIVTALSGSGPAYFFRIMESLQAAATSLGLPEKTAYLLTLQTALGSAKLAMESADTIATLRQSVTSPGGTTEQGLKVMDDNNIDKVIEQVVKAAYQRSKELAAQMGE
jgi:pyrroline-5-carboxylate reductase